MIIVLSLHHNIGREGDSKCYNAFGIMFGQQVPRFTPAMEAKNVLQLADDSPCESPIRALVDAALPRCFGRQGRKQYEQANC